MIQSALMVFIGGGLGSVSRWLLTLLAHRFYTGVFPLGTLLSNVVSSAILAFGVFYFMQKTDMHTSLRLLLLTGFCGGFSTFSTFSFENVELMKTGNYTIALLNILLSLAICFALMYVILKNK